MEKGDYLPSQKKFALGKMVKRVKHWGRGISTFRPSPFFRVWMDRDSLNNSVNHLQCTNCGEYFDVLNMPLHLFDCHNKHSMPLTLGQKLRALREKRGWSKQFLADKMNISRLRIFGLEGDRHKMLAEEIYTFSKLFGVPLISFFEETDEKVHGWMPFGEGDKVEEGKNYLVRFNKMYPSIAFFSGMSNLFHHKDSFITLKVDEYMEIPE